MNVIIIFNKKKHKINIHKYDSILSIKNIINKIIFKEEYNINDIQLYYDKKKLNNEDYCDKYKIKENDKITVHLPKKGGNLGKKIAFYICCIIIILVPILILPTGINTGGVSLVASILGKAKDEFSRYLICELKYRTLVSRLGSFINFIKYVLFIMATYVIITIGCVVACCMTKGGDIKGDPNKICTPYYVGSTAGLILTVLYFFIYFAMRFGDKILKPLENWAAENFVTNMLIRPIFAFLYKIVNSIKFVFVYFIPVIGTLLKLFHTGIDLGFPGLILVLDSVAEAGCSSGNLNSIKNQFMNKFKKIVSNAKNNNKKGNENENENEKTKKENKKQLPLDLYSFKFQNGIIDNNDYEETLKELRSKIKPEVNPLCKDPPGGSCCNRDKILMIAEFFENMLKVNPEITQQLKDYRVYMGVNLALIGMYEKAIYNDDVPLIFENKNIVEKKILLKIVYDTFKDEMLMPHNKNGKKVHDEIEKIIFGKDEDFPDEKNFARIEKQIEEYVHKDDIKNINKIKEVQSKIIELEAKNKEHAEKEGSKYEAGDSPTKFFIKNIFINGLCNVFTTSKSAVSVVDEIGGLNELIDILKCGSASGVIMALIYLIVIIVLIICGIFGIY